MRFIAALGVGALLLFGAGSAAATRTFPSTTSFTVEQHGISGTVSSSNPRCLRHRTVTLTLRALTAEEAGLDFHLRVVHTGKRRHWHLSVPIPKKMFTLEVGLEAKALGHTGPYENSCGGWGTEKAFNIER